MEEIFNFLPAVVVFFWVVSGLLNKLKDLSIDIDGDIGGESAGEGSTFRPSGEEVSDLTPDASESFDQMELAESREKTETDSRTREPEEKPEKSKKTASDYQAASGSSKKKEIKDKIKATEGEILSRDDFNRREIVKGIIFKEILDKPRSKKQHPFFEGEKR